MKKKVLIPTPSQDFDPTEVSVPWKFLKQNQVEVIFATPDGIRSHADFRMIDGSGLGIWKHLLKATSKAAQTYQEMHNSHEFQNPIKWSDINTSEFDGIILPGGHAPGMKEYLESEILQNKIMEFFNSNKIIGAVCHGVVLVTRTKNSDGKSILFGKKTTSLLEKQELLAWNMTRWWLKDYYRTYPETVEAEVKRNLKFESDFIHGPTPVLRDDEEHLDRGFIVQDQNYLSARWPGDIHLFSKSYMDLLSK